eukprot:COSAG01_NODE_35677_length_528_cov_1.177156_1_plen_99_part_00
MGVLAVHDKLREFPCPACRARCMLPNATCLCPQEIEAESRAKHGERPFTNCLAAGEISVFSDMTAHASPPNVLSSGRRRCSLILRYAPVSVRAYAGLV